MPGDRVLVAEYDGGRVSERDVTGKVLWEHALQRPISCQRLPNGNTFIAQENGVVEVTRDGKTVFSAKTGYIYEGHRLPSGRILCSADFGVLELSPEGKELRRLPVGQTRRTEPAAGGRFLTVTAGWGGGDGVVREIDAAGKVVWQARLSPGNISAHRLPGGNILAAKATEKLVVEIDPTGKEVWKVSTPGRPFRARRY